MATLTRGQSISAAQSRKAEKAAGWVMFAAMMLGIGGTFGIIHGLVGLERSKFTAPNAVYVFSDLRTWSWIVLIVGILALCAAFSVPAGTSWSRWIGILAAAAQALAQVLFIQSYPFWSLMVFAVDVLVIYALSVYGGREVEV